MSKMTKKVILFIVEGITEKNSLSLILSRLLPDKKIIFHIIMGDITSDKYTTIQNCINKLDDKIKTVINEYKYKKTDILEVIHLADTDGTYIKNEFVKEHSTDNIIYKLDCMLTNRVDLTIARNQKKSNILNKLSTTSKINTIPYFIYYFSCNLEHVLHNKQNLDDNLKSKYSEDFQDEYYENEAEFKNFIQNNDFSVKGDYRATWNFIKTDNNSLKRFSNFGLFFERN